MKSTHIVAAFVTPLIVLSILTAPAHAQWSLNGVKIFYNAGNVGIGTNNPAYPLDVRTAGSRAIYGLATPTTGTADGVYGQSSSAAGRGLVGYASKATGANYGVYGRSNSTTGRGVYGYASATSGTNFAVYGKTNSPTGFAGYFSGGRNYFSGNVGVGLTNPAAKIEILSSSSGNALGLQVKNAATRILTAFGNGAVLMGPVDSIAGVWVGGDASGGINAAVIGYQSGSQAIERMRMTDSKLSINGTVGLGVVDPAFQLQLSANSAAKPTSNTWTIASDRRLKTNIQPISGALDQLLQLHGVTYQWIHPQTQGDMTGTYTGMIAQDVEKIFPEWVSDGHDGYKRLTVIGFEGLTVEALRDLREEKDREVASLREQNAMQKQQIDDLTARLEKLERCLAGD